jgi:hypothetical protein
MSATVTILPNKPYLPPLSPPSQPPLRLEVKQTTAPVPNQNYMSQQYPNYADPYNTYGYTSQPSTAPSYWYNGRGYRRQETQPFPYGNPRFDKNLTPQQVYAIENDPNARAWYNNYMQQKQRSEQTQKWVQSPGSPYVKQAGGGGGQPPKNISKPSTVHTGGCVRKQGSTNIYCAIVIFLNIIALVIFFFAFLSKKRLSRNKRRTALWIFGFIFVVILILTAIRLCNS